ncbi:hypothetical protein [Streptomyces sp. TUS-ST3]|uniref:hypothetical protein n=1 Tax=Streptomyces sp. TUS-ST3 TaxID=3025591 RepID=UPI0024E106A1|nr:hypothetical protein [Streptomyces sp. TUS-ST3]
MSCELRPSIAAPRSEELAAVLKRVRAELRQGQPDIHQGGRKSPSHLLQSC